MPVVPEDGGVPVVPEGGGVPDPLLLVLEPDPLPLLSDLDAITFCVTKVVPNMTAVTNKIIDVFISTQITCMIYLRCI